MDATVRSLAGVQLTLVGVACMIWAAESVDGTPVFTLGMALILVGSVVVGTGVLRER